MKLKRFEVVRKLMTRSSKLIAIELGDDGRAKNGARAYPKQYEDVGIVQAATRSGAILEAIQGCFVEA